MNIMGIDAGGTNVKLYCEIDHTVYSDSIPSGNGFAQQDFLDCVEKFILTLPRSIDAIGIAHSGLGTVSGIDKTVRPYLKNLNIHHFDFLNTKVCFINDSNAATIAGTLEYPNAKVLVGVTNGTGIAAGICLNGNLFLGSHGYAGEINSNYLGNTRAIHLCAGSVLFTALQEHPEEESKLIKNSSENFGLLLTHVVNLLNPDVIYLSGGTFNYPGYFENVVKTIKEKGVDFLVENLQVVLSTYGAYPGCLGAIQYAKQLFTEQT